MDAISALILLGAGTAMGFVNNLAGAGGLIGLMAFDLCTGMSTTAANASLRPAAVAVSVSGLATFRLSGRAIPAASWRLGLASIPGAVLGALLAVTLPVWVYRIALAAIIAAVLYQQLHPGARRESASANPRTSGAAAIGMFTLVGLHMGFVQVAVGLLTMAALTRVRGGDLLQINSAKMAILTLTSLTSAVVLAVSGAIDWQPALWLAGGAATGSFLAGRWSIRRGHGAIRAAVLVICLLVLVRMASQLIAEL